MYQATLTAGQTSAPQAAGIGSVARLTISSGSGYVEYTTGSFADIGNNVATWKTWPKGTVGATAQDTAGFPMIVRFTCVTGTASAMLADPSDAEFPSNALMPWESMQPSYAYDASGNVTGLLGPDGSIDTLFPYNDGTRDIFRMASNSWLQLGVAAQGSGKELVNVTQLNTNTEAVARPTLMFVDQGINPSAGGTVDWHSLDVRAYGGGSNANFSANSGFYAVEGKTQVTATAGQTIGKTVGVFGSSMGTGSSHTLSLSIGVQGEVQQTGAGTTVAGRAFSAKTPTVSAGTLTTAYGFYAEDVLAGGTNYAIYTNAGRVRFFSGTAVPAGGTAGVGVTMSSTSDLGVFFGSGAPTLSAAQGSLYLRTDGSSTSTRLYVNTNGSTGWTNVTTAA